MKRYIIIAAAALLAVSCAKHFDVNTTSEQTIGFGTWTETLTKARTQGDGTFTVGDDFAVYGSKIVNSPASTTPVFDDDVVTMTVAGVPGTWTYSPTRYWDQNTDSYVFYAISPASIGTGGTVNPQTGVITSASITFAGNNNDILVADKETVLNGAYGTTVELDFNHVASLVDFKVSKAPNLHDATVKITGFTLGNIQTTGVLSVTDAYDATVYGGTNGPVASWSSTATGSYLPAAGVTPVYGDNGSSAIAADNGLTIVEDDVFPVPAEPGSGKSTTVVNHLVVKPQTFTAPSNRAEPTNAANDAAQKITISYTITTTDANSGTSTNTYTSTLWLYDFDIVNDTDQTDTAVASWDTGKHYTFYITIDSTPIVFGASINDWTVGTGYHYLLN
jgi:hypothetical protein